MPNMQTGTGLIDEFSYTIKDATFAFDARFGDGEIALLQLSGINSETADQYVKDLDMDAWVAESWVGLTVSLARREKPLTINGEHVTQKYFEVTGIDNVEFNGSAPAPATPEIPKSAEVKLTKLAASCGTFEEFIDAAYGDIEGLTGSSFEDHVVDDSDAGFYATHKG